MYNLNVQCTPYNPNVQFSIYNPNVQCTILMCNVQHTILCAMYNPHVQYTTYNPNLLCTYSKWPYPDLLQTTTALIYDGISLLDKALSRLSNAQPIETTALSCTKAQAWSGGSSLLNYLKMVSSPTLKHIFVTLLKIIYL